MKRWYCSAWLLGALMSVHATPLSNGVGFFGSPFLLEENSSLMALSERIWSSVDYGLRESDGMQSVGVAYLHPIKKNALSLQYRRNMADTINRMSTGFGFDGGRVLFGSAMHLIVKGKIGFTLDLSTSYKFQQNNYISLNLKNIFLTDTIFGKNFREASLLYSTILSNRLRLAAQSSLNATLIDSSLSDFYLTWYACIEKSFLFNPSFTLYLESKLHPLSQKEINIQLGGGAGWQMNIGLTRLGFLTGYRNNLYKNNHELHGAIVFTPSRPRDRIAPRCKVSLSDTLFSLGGNKNPQQLLIALWCKESSRESGVAKWILKIAEGTWQGAEVIRTYAGGAIPPSSISWNMLNTSEKIVSPGDYFVQLIGVDAAGNVGKTAWQKIVIRP